MRSKGLVQLVGAGPGDPELLTLKAIRAIEHADVILYDALVHTDTLKYNTLGAKEYVGKRKGKHHISQQKINERIVHHALSGKRVVRLKGGDVSIFARAAEELEYVHFFGIKTQLIPGISSYSAIAAQLQIPLTRRCFYESIWVTTGYTCEGKISSDIPLAAQSSSTIVVFMGISKLSEIIEVFLKHKPASYPIAIIQHGTLPHEKHVVADLGTIVTRVVEEAISNPAIIIIGKAVKDQVTRFDQLQAHLSV